MPGSPLTRLSSAWRRHDAPEFFRLVVKNLVHYAGKVVSGRTFSTKPAASEFDETYGMDTESIWEIGEMDVAAHPNARHAVRYQPSPANIAADAIGALKINYSDFIFLDFGAGKGRVLTIAAEFPFRSVIGIEFSTALCDIAAKNIAQIDLARRAAAKVECVNADVTSYRLPRSPLVCYFYNPFDRIVMTEVANRLGESLREAPRDIFLLYLDPAHRDVFERSGSWSVIRDEKNLLVLKSYT